MAETRILARDISRTVQCILSFAHTHTALSANKPVWQWKRQTLKDIFFFFLKLIQRHIVSLKLNINQNFVT